MKDLILKTLEDKKISNKKGWIIIFDGERLIMNSGKLIWTAKHHAVNALIGSVKDVTGVPTTRENSVELHVTIKQLEQEGRIKYELV